MMNSMPQKLPHSSKLVFLAIVVFALWLRTFNVNWDQHQHLHPDERFLTMVMGNMVLPTSFQQYLDPDSSTFNPVNIGHEFYVYGTLPLVMNKLLAMLLGNDNYNNLTLQGRWLSAIMDVVTLTCLMLFVRTLEQRHKLSSQLTYLAGFLYAISVLAIQQSHFFTTDTFALAFFMMSLWAASRIPHAKQLVGWVIISALAFGFSMASKINAVFGLPLLIWFLADPLSLLPVWKKKKQFFLQCVGIGVVMMAWGALSWMTLRVAEPYYFAKFSFFDSNLHPVFIKNIETLKTFSDKDAFFPPAVQWINKIPILFPLVNIAMFGLGLPLFFVMMYGIGSLIRSSVFRIKERIELVVILLWMCAFSVYQGLQFVATMRYFLVLYPFFALLAAVGIIELARRVQLRTKLSKRKGIYLYIVVLFICSLWTMMFMGVYTRENTRVRASRWMYDVLPNKSVVALEHWDDPIPLQIEGANPENKIITGEQVPVFYPDNEVKWKEIEMAFEKSDYYIITSNRTWGSITTVPDKFPKMTAFYEGLFSGNTQFEKVAEFTAYPNLSYLGIPIYINDDWAEEAFTVYDHPKVMIFAKK